MPQDTMRCRRRINNDITNREGMEGAGASGEGIGNSGRRQCDQEGGGRCWEEMLGGDEEVQENLRGVKMNLREAIVTLESSG